MTDYALQNFFGNNERGDAACVFANIAVAEICSDDRIELIKRALQKAIDSRNDEAAAKLLDLLVYAFRLKEREVADITDHHYGNALKMSQISFWKWLRKWYWTLPKSYHDKADIYHAREHPCFAKTKMAAVSTAFEMWDGEQISESIDAFLFLMAAHAPLSASDISTSANEHEVRSRGHYVTQEEKKHFEQMLYKRIDEHSFPAELIMAWIVAFPMAPHDVRETLTKQWARKGGPQLVERYVKNAAIAAGTGK